VRIYVWYAFIFAHTVADVVGSSVSGFSSRLVLFFLLIIMLCLKQCTSYHYLYHLYHSPLVREGAQNKIRL
jgi:hypothetical protein